ncbi:ABC transporter permease [Algoriphagus ornithinivorans]|nr:ABC transporter permease [Algoriphagus ornithinivorans]
MNLLPIKISIRSYLRNRLYTALNLTSLVLGLVIVFLGISFLVYEFSYDKFHEDQDEIFRVVRKYRGQNYGVNGFPSWSESTSDEQLLMINSIESLPEIEAVSQFVVSPVSQFVNFEGNRISSQKVLSTNTPKSFSRTFTFPIKSGSWDDFSSRRNSVLLTESFAKQIPRVNYLQQEELIGKTIMLNDELYVISGILQDAPTNSHFDFDLILNAAQLDNWGSRIYIKKNSSVSHESLEKAIDLAIERSNPRLAADELYTGHLLQPISDIHFQKSVLYDLKPSGNLLYVFLIGGFTIFILLITLFNYSNLTMAIYSKKSRAIGTKKAIGASKSSLYIQILSDGLMLVLIAIPIAFLFLELLLQYFNQLMEVQLETSIFKNWQNLLIFLIIAFSLGILASIWPMLFLGNKSVVHLFKDTLSRNQRKAAPINNYLILGQLVIVIVISSLSLFVINQLDYIESKEIGFEKNNILYVYSSPESVDEFQQELVRIAGIKKIGNGSPFGTSSFNTITYSIPGSQEIFDDSRQLYLDPEALEIYGLKTSLAQLPQSRLTLINQSAAEKIAKVRRVETEDLIGTQIITEPEYENTETGEMGIPFEIGGIFNDIHLFSLHEKIEPYFITVIPDLKMDGRTIVEVYPGKEEEVLQEIEKVYAGISSDIPLEIEFLDQNIFSLYQNDVQFKRLVIYLAGLAIFLCLLGLVGMTLFMIRARTKEIGIRKVLGASVFGIILNINQSYLKLMGIALLVAWPISIYLAYSWLNTFAYRISINIWLVPFLGLLIFMLAFAILSWVASKSALANPVKSIQSE